MTWRSKGLDRRTLLAGAGALAAVAAGGRPAIGQEAPPLSGAALEPQPLVSSAQFNEAFAKIVGDSKPVEGRMTLEMPEDAENGNIVPYKINVESPMTDADHIQRAYLLSTQNPQASVATFHLTPLSGRATVSGRMRLAKTQEVVALAVTSDNTLLIARQKVDVGIGGCGVE